LFGSVYRSTETSIKKYGSFASTQNWKKYPFFSLIKFMLIKYPPRTNHILLDLTLHFNTTMLMSIWIYCLHDDDLEIFLQTTFSGFFIRFRDPDYPLMNHVEGYFDVSDNWERPQCPHSPNIRITTLLYDFFSAFEKSVGLCYQQGKQGVTLYKYEHYFGKEGLKIVTDNPLTNTTGRPFGYIFNKLSETETIRDFKKEFVIKPTSGRKNELLEPTGAVSQASGLSTNHKVNEQTVNYGKSEKKKKTLSILNDDKEPVEPNDTDGTKNEEEMKRREYINYLVKSIYLASEDDRNNNKSGERDVALEMKKNHRLVKAIYANDIEYCYEHGLSIPNYDKEYAEMKRKYSDALLTRKPYPSKMKSDDECKHIITSDDYALFARKPEPKKRKYQGHKNYRENVRTKKHKKYSAYLTKCKQEIKEKMKQLRELEDKKSDSDSDEESDSNSDDNCFSDSDEGSD
jgi:hypothetical protein